MPQITNEQVIEVATAKIGCGEDRIESVYRWQFEHALAVVRATYRSLTRSKREAAWRARLTRLPPPEEALKEADRDKLAAYLLELLPDGDPTEFFRDLELQARLEEVERITARRRSGGAAAAS